jgi:hypothetical protein
LVVAAPPILGSDAEQAESLYAFFIGETCLHRGIRMTVEVLAIKVSLFWPLSYLVINFFAAAIAPSFDSSSQKKWIGII